MKKSVYIRPAVVSDAPEIEAVRLYTWKTTYLGLMPEKMLDQRIADIEKRTEITRQKIADGQPFFAAEYDGQIVGMAVCTPSRNPDYPGDGEIQAIYILKAFQGLGIGRKLFDFCCEYLRGCGHTEMIVNCLDGNPSAAFYEKMGGQVIGKRQDPLGDTVINEIIFRFAI